METDMLEALLEMQESVTWSNSFRALLTAAWFVLNLFLGWLFQRASAKQRESFEQSLESVKSQLRGDVSRLEAELQVQSHRHISVVSRRFEVLEQAFTLTSRLRRVSKGFQNKPYQPVREGEDLEETRKELIENLYEPLAELPILADEKAILLRKEEIASLKAYCDKLQNLLQTDYQQKQSFNHARKYFDDARKTQSYVMSLHAEAFNNIFEEATAQVAKLQQDIDAACDLLQSNYRKEYEPWMDFDVQRS